MVSMTGSNMLGSNLRIHSVDAGSALRLDLADFLLSAQAGEAAARLHGTALDESNLLFTLTELRRTFRPEEAAALLAMAQVRKRALTKFPNAQQMFFTSESFEQATAWPVALHRAKQLDAWAPPGTVLDLGCGIGGDTLALAQFRCVIAYERDLLRLRFAQANLALHGLEHRVEFRHADWTADLAQGNLPSVAAAFVDPARRVDGRRKFSLHDIDPPLSKLLSLQAEIPNLAVKVMPGVQDAELPANCSVEFVSHQGVCKEAVLWMVRERGGARERGRQGEGERGRQGEVFSALHASSSGRDASVLTDSGWIGIAATGRLAPVGDLRAGQFLYEPDPAVIRAGALAELCDEFDTHLFDEQIAYLVGEHAVQPNHPWRKLVHGFVIEEIHPFALKRLNLRLLALSVGQVELKKRGFPEEPEALRTRLKLTPGGRDAVIFFTRRGDERILLIGRRLAVG